MWFDIESVHRVGITFENKLNSTKKNLFILKRCQNNLKNPLDIFSNLSQWCRRINIMYFRLKLKCYPAIESSFTISNNNNNTNKLSLQTQNECWRALRRTRKWFINITYLKLLTCIRGERIHPIIDGKNIIPSFQWYSYPFCWNLCLKNKLFTIFTVSTLLQFQMNFFLFSPLIVEIHWCWLKNLNFRYVVLVFFFVVSQIKLLYIFHMQLHKGYEFL
jgi:hypothetical protein